MASKFLREEKISTKWYITLFIYGKLMVRNGILILNMEYYKLKNK